MAEECGGSDLRAERSGCVMLVNDGIWMMEFEGWNVDGRMGIEECGWKMWMGELKDESV